MSVGCRLTDARREGVRAAVPGDGRANRRMYVHLYSSSVLVVQMMVCVFSYDQIGTVLLSGGNYLLTIVCSLVWKAINSDQDQALGVEAEQDHHTDSAEQDQALGVEQEDLDAELDATALSAGEVSCCGLSEEPHGSQAAKKPTVTDTGQSVTPSLCMRPAMLNMFRLPLCWFASVCTCMCLCVCA